MRDLERWQQLEGELERRVEAMGTFDPTKGDNPLEGLTLPDLLGILKHFTGDLVLSELHSFATDPTITPDDFVDRLFEIADNLLATGGEALALNQGGLVPIRSVQIADLKAEVKRALRSRRPAPLPELLHLPADLIVKRSFEAFLPGNMARETNDMGFFAVYSWGDKPGKRIHSEGRIGYEDNPGEAVWKFTQTRGAMLAKLQLALWARASDVGSYNEKVELSIVELCDDLGYKRKKGGHRRERKIEVGQALRCLRKLQVEARPVVQGKTFKLSGPLWAIGLEVAYEDLFDSVPCFIRFSVGDWFHQPAWRGLNKQIATVSAGALKLSTDKNDQGAIFLACYFSILPRMDGNKATKQLKAETLADQSGLAETYRNRPGRLQEAVERALDRLVEVGVVKRWRLNAVDPCADPDDLDNPETLATLAEDGAKVKRHWLTQVYEIEWPDNVVRTGPAIAKGRAQHAKRLNAQPGSRSKGRA